MLELPYSALTPEIWIGSMACLILLIDLFNGPRKLKLSYYLSIFTLMMAFFLTFRLLGLGRQNVLGVFILDPPGNLLKLILYSVAILVFIYSHQYVRQHKISIGDYYALCLFSILGMMLLISAYSLLTLYLGVELLALPLYALIAIAPGKRATEAAMKYFVLGALASGMMLYGISLLYGTLGTFDIPMLATRLNNAGELQQYTLILSMIFILAGLAFKLGAVPFHMWVPDVYEGSAASVTLFIGTLPEIAGIGMALRLLWETFPLMSEIWQQLFIVIALLTLAIGNIVAIAQTNLKRMLAYSSIGHIGFVVLGFIAAPEVGYAPALAYIFIYALMALGAFGIITVLSHQGFEAENIADFRGLGKSQPWVALMMLLILFSLSGVPPTIGFYAKFLILDALIQAKMVWLAIAGVIFTVIGAFYYLRVVRVMFFDEPHQYQTVKQPACQKVVGVNLGLVSFNGLLMLALGIYPAPLINACLAVFKY